MRINVVESGAHFVFLRRVHFREAGRQSQYCREVELTLLTVLDDRVPRRPYSPSTEDELWAQPHFGSLLNRMPC